MRKALVACAVVLALTAAVLFWTRSGPGDAAPLSFGGAEGGFSSCTGDESAEWGDAFDVVRNDGDAPARIIGVDLVDAKGVTLTEAYVFPRQDGLPSAPALWSESELPASAIPAEGATVHPGGRETELVVALRLRVTPDSSYAAKRITYSYEGSERSVQTKTVVELSRDCMAYGLPLRAS